MENPETLLKWMIWVVFNHPLVLGSTQKISRWMETDFSNSWINLPEKTCEGPVVPTTNGTKQPFLGETGDSQTGDSQTQRHVNHILPVGGGWINPFEEKCGFLIVSFLQV